ncbi:phenylacetate--CoA ligase family protein [Ancylomarina euxinus]|uniref:Phenylacetate--CoA ligase family protein n=2 Tax=Ancylomarina euxinus TaxID=2283627 RepID=A0A425Y6Z0_9BACT|nr:phenylacetate--CoA ligase family protein [Ancylomarina euxinus]
MMNLSKILFQIGAKYRNPSLWKHYSELKQTEKYSFEELQAYQEFRLKKLLSFIGLNSAYYKELFQKSGINPQTLTLKDFFNIPITSKSELLSRKPDIYQEKKFEKEFLCETSGTSGEVLTFYRNESWDSFNRASMLRGYSWHGVKPWESNLYFWGYNTGASERRRIRFFDFLLNRYRMFDYDEKSLLSLEKKLPNVKYIEGYSSVIYELANLMEKRGIIHKNLKMIKGTSEKIYPHYQDVVKKVFGHKIISEYGAAETGIIAFECSKGNMHINMEGVYVETDENNEIIVTNLHSYSFPIIRYKLGDSVVLAPRNKKCKCGLQHPIIEEINGRVGKSILGENKKYPSLTLYYVFKNIYLKHKVQINYQAHQVEKGKLDIWLKEEVSDKMKDLILVEAHKYFDTDIDLNILHRTNFREQSGKLRDFITTID